MSCLCAFFGVRALGLGAREVSESSSKAFLIGGSPQKERKTSAPDDQGHVHKGAVLFWEP